MIIIMRGDLDLKRGWGVGLGRTARFRGWVTLMLIIFKYRPKRGPGRTTQ